MNNTAPIWMGIAAIAGLVFVVALGVSYVLYDLGLNGSVFVAVIVSGVAAVALALGWRPARNDPDAAHSKGSETVDMTKAAPATPAAAAVRDAAPGHEAEAERKAVAEEEGMQQVTTEAEVTPTQPTPAPPVTPSPGKKPPVLAAARDNRPDDLKLISGVGPKLEQTLHGMGIFHFDQIAAWGPDELAWMDDNLAGFKGRASRDNWVAQAKTMAAGV
ncbi:MULTISPECIES: NADH:ubiquinone oxidoreductase [unclassified Yoonia]|uniref:NADH:ubiquinone oxidoreductase n=1 Tax=unclassified Yoonia TaxID=2629118 RepID=UPI002AFE3EA8|nr:MULTISPECIES: NADH:ubiquinone oxidoreductase [unclassified Yoonia]